MPSNATTYCNDCGCPANEHDALGVCHALDLPALGFIDECKCSGLK